MVTSKDFVYKLRARTMHYSELMYAEEVSFE